MIIHQLIIEGLKAKGASVRLLEDRPIESYSWEEITGIHPQALEIAANLLQAGYCPSLSELETKYTPSLAPLADESEYDYDQRIASYVQHGYFPARLNETLLTNSGNGVVVCFNPFIEVMDELSDTPLVLTTRDAIDTILRGSRSDLSAIAPYSESESIDTWIGRLIGDAYMMGASDIEVTSNTSAMRVRLHVVGEWTDWIGSLPLIQRSSMLRALCASATPPVDYEPGTVHDFKVERRINGVDTSWRVSITPAALGDSVTMRVLPQIGRVPSLQELGYCEKSIKLFLRASRHIDGLILVTGPTGSGKSTTLYSLVSRMRDENRKVFTVEDPVELVVPGTVQVQVLDDESMDEKYRVTFATAIRTALRHKPDVLVIGETRDTETAQAGVGASRTGHLTFTTLHTTNVRTTVKRMVDLGIDSTNLGDTLRLVVSQTLLPTLCPHCRIEHPNGEASRNPHGCTYCKNRGIAGKTVIYEMCYLDERARECLIDGKLHKEFSRLAEEGMYIGKNETMRRLVQEGLIDRKYREEHDFGL